MKRNRVILVAATAAAVVLAGLGVLIANPGAVYPILIYDAYSPSTKRDTTLTQTEWNDLQDEVQATETELGVHYARRGLTNLVPNGSFEAWGSGAPEGWTISGTAATSSQQADAEDGAYSAQLTAGSAASKLAATVAATISSTQNARFRGTAFTLTARVKASATNACRLQISDGINPAQSAYHSGGGSWEMLSVTLSLDSSATLLEAGLLNDKTDSSTACKFDSVNLVEGFFPQQAYTKNYTLGTLSSGQAQYAGGSTSTHGLRGVICKTYTGGCYGPSCISPACSPSGAAETDMIGCTIPANVLSAGKSLHIVGFLTYGANANSKRVKVYWGSTAITGNMDATQNGGGTKVEAWVNQLSSGSSQWAYGEARTTLLGGLIGGGGGSYTEDPTGSVAFKIVGSSPTASDVCSKGGYVEVLE